MGAVAYSTDWMAIRGSIDLDRVNNLHYRCLCQWQMILFRRSDYIALDGHSMVKSEVLEDVKLAQRVKQAGKAAEIRPAPWSFQVRLYRSLSDYQWLHKEYVWGLGRNAMLVLVQPSFCSSALSFPILFYWCPYMED